MMRASNIAAATVATLLLSSGAPIARADTYDYAVDRFEADGNVHGPLDGTPDVVEEFDDGTMGPLFSPVAGTALETGGALHLQSPGLSVAIPGITPTAFETSAVVSGALNVIEVGGGDAVLRMVVPPQAIGGNDALNFLVSSVDDTGLYYAGVSIANFNGPLAERTVPPLTPGLSILSHQEEINYATGNEQLILENDPIDAGSITGPIVLELRYDDTTQTLTSAYSLDGGVTFTAGFTPIPLVTSQGTARAYISSVAHEGECPAGIGITRARLSGLGRPGLSTMLIRAAFGGNTRGYEKLRLVVTDEGAGGATLLDVQLPDTLVSTPKCNPLDGWSGGRGFRYRYTNYSNALPPDCIPGTAQGLRRADFRWTGTNYLKVKVAKASLPQVVGPLRLALYRGTGPVNECDGFVGTAGCIVVPGKAKCSAAY